MVTLQDVQKVTYFIPNYAARGAANWRPSEDVDNHDQARPGAPLRTRVCGFARWRKDWAKVSSEFAQDRRA